MRSRKIAEVGALALTAMLAVTGCPDDPCVVGVDCTNPIATVNATVTTTGGMGGKGGGGSGGSASCGNDVLDDGEQCDGDELGGTACSDAIGPWSVEGTLACTEQCTFDTTKCSLVGHYGSAVFDKSTFGP